MPNTRPDSSALNVCLTQVLHRPATVGVVKCPDITSSSPRNSPTWAIPKEARWSEKSKVSDKSNSLGCVTRIHLGPATRNALSGMLNHNLAFWPRAFRQRNTPCCLALPKEAVKSGLQSSRTRVGERMSLRNVSDCVVFMFQLPTPHPNRTNGAIRFHSAKGSNTCSMARAPQVRMGSGTRES